MKLIFKNGTEFELDRYTKEIGDYNGRKYRLNITPTYTKGLFEKIVGAITDDNISEFSIVEASETNAFSGYTFDGINENHDANGTIINLKFIKSVDGSKINTEDDQEIPESVLDAEEEVPGVAIPDTNEDTSTDESTEETTEE